MIGSVGKLVKGVDGDEKISLDEDNSRCSYNQEGAGLHITNFPPEPNDFRSNIPRHLICKVTGSGSPSGVGNVDGIRQPLRSAVRNETEIIEGLSDITRCHRTETICL